MEVNAVLVLALVISLFLTIYAYGWKTALVNAAVIGGLLIAYALVVNLFGQSGKVVLAILLIILALIFFAARSTWLRGPGKRE